LTVIATDFDVQTVAGKFQPTKRFQLDSDPDFLSTRWSLLDFFPSATTASLFFLPPDHFQYKKFRDFWKNFRKKVFLKIVVNSCFGGRM
jgi:hypothetical protein